MLKAYSLHKDLHFAGEGLHGQLPLLKGVGLHTEPRPTLFQAAKPRPTVLAPYFRGEGLHSTVVGLKAYSLD